MDLSKRDARRLLLDRQGLLTRDSFGRGKNAVKKAALQMGWVQIDTISVVERAHHHVLHTRVSNYDPSHLHRLQKDDKTLFEYWYHALAYLPMTDFRYYLPIMAGSAGKRTPDPKIAPEILKRIEAEGPLQSRDFEAPPNRKSSGWWDWKPAKVALEFLFLSGELMVSHRDGFQKVYDLRERVLPDHVDTTVPDREDFMNHIILSMVDACAIASDHDVGYRKTALRQLTGESSHREFPAAVERLVENGDILSLDVEGTTYYTRPETLDALPIRLGKRRVTFLSPFDNLVINRRRTNDLFGFDYLIECYVPEAKRQYGYFCLPMLFGDELIGRMDAKADRKSGTLIVRNMVLDHPDACRDALPGLQDDLMAFAAQNDCDTIAVENTTPKSLRKTLC